LGTLLCGQPSGEVGCVLVDNRAPKGYGVELRMQLGAFLALPLHRAEVKLAHLLAA
jgi:hypothetical protein